MTAPSDIREGASADSSEPTASKRFSPELRGRNRTKIRIGRFVRARVLDGLPSIPAASDG
jgi:hypothetical protein